MRLFQVFHENGNNDIDEDKLRHEYENDEEERSEVWWNTTVPQTVVAFLALFTQSVLHNAVPVVARGDPEQGEERHPERTEVGVLAKTLARVVLITFCKKTKANYCISFTKKREWKCRRMDDSVC